LTKKKKKKVNEAALVKAGQVGAVSSHQFQTPLAFFSLFFPLQSFKLPPKQMLPQ
jgi:hypothetical protein